MTKTLVEQGVITEAAAEAAAATGRLPMQFISPGWGSSGYYSPAVLQEAATNGFIPEGTHMYADHPTSTEDLERPGRSIKDLMAVTVGKARVATAEDAKRWGADEGALVGEVDVVPSWRPLLETVRNHIGASIRASATDVVEGEAEGRRGRIVEGLVAPATSVDFVTRAGRGGRVLQVLESAQREHDVLHRVDEATATDRMSHLRDAVRDTHGADGNSVWVRDQDAEKQTVFFDQHDYAGGSGGPKTFQQNYRVGDNDVDVALVGKPLEVRPTTNYVPVTRPDSKKPTATESEEDNMGKIQIEEAEHTGLIEKAGRVDGLVTENDTLKADNAKLREAAAVRDRSDRAGALLLEHRGDVEFTQLETRGLLADLPLKEGALDEEAFTKRVKEEAARVAEAGGAGRVRGFGGSSSSGGDLISWDDIDKIGQEA